MVSANYWFLNMDKGKYVGPIFIDLKKAFDMVDHEILLKILKMYGITGLNMTGLHLIWKIVNNFIG